MSTRTIEDMARKAFIPKFWRGPNGASMPTEFFAPWSTAYPKEAEGWQPMFTAEQVALVRAQAMDEAAAVCQQQGGAQRTLGAREDFVELAARILALKDRT